MSASAAAAAAAATATDPAYRDPLPYLTEEELVQRLGGVRDAKVSVDQELVSDMDDAKERDLLTRVASTIMAFFVGHFDPVGYTKRVTETCIDLKVTFPMQTVFDCFQFDVIRHLDEDRIRKVWVQMDTEDPEAPTASIVVSMFRTDAERDMTVLDVVLVQKKVRRESSETYDGDVDSSIGRNAGKRRRGAKS